jgi:hypothetical protein
MFTLNIGMNGQEAEKAHQLQRAAHGVEPSIEVFTRVDDVEARASAS